MAIHYIIFVYCWFSNLVIFADSYRFEPNSLTLNNISVCPEEDKNSVHLDVSIVLTARNKYMVNGEATFEEYLPGPLELQLISKRCDNNMTLCENFDTLNIRDICKLFDLEEQFWSGYMKHVEPKIMCPFRKRAYKVIDAPVDMGYVAHLPLDGYTWSFTLKVFKTLKGQKKKRMVFCQLFEMTITKTRSGRRKN